MDKTSLKKCIWENLFSIKISKHYIIFNFLFMKMKIKSNKLVALQKETEILQKEVRRQQNNIKQLTEERNCLLRNYTNFTPRTNKNNVYLLNDTRRDKNHAGCSLVFDNINKACIEHGMNIFFADSSYPNNCSIADGYEDIISKCDYLIFNGEGTLHDSRAFSMFDKCRIAKEAGKKVFLINTVWQRNPETEKYLEYFDLISCRESLSYDEFPETAKHKLRIVPDMTFYGKKLHNNDKQKKIIFTDSALIDVTERMKVLAKDYNAEFFCMILNDKKDSKYLTEEFVASLSPDSLIVTGRFHALTLGMKYGIPTLAMPSNTHKVQGLLKDSELEDFLLQDFETIDYKIKNLDRSVFVKNAQKYCDDANVKIENLFNDIFKA